MRHFRIQVVKAEDYFGPGVWTTASGDNVRVAVRAALLLAAAKLGLPFNAKVRARTIREL